MPLPRSFSTRARVALVVLGGALAACGGDKPSGPSAPPTAVASSLAEQAGTVATTVGVLPAVTLKDGSGRPMVNANVVFKVGPASGVITDSVKKTDANGVATLGGWTLGTQAGAQIVTVTAAKVPGAIVTFTVNAAAGDPAAMTRQSGDAQQGVVGTALATPLVVKVVDAWGNARGGATVNFASTNGGRVTYASAITDGGGLASAGNWTLGGGSGTQTLLASVGAVSTTFTAAAIAGAPVALAKDAGDDSYASLGGPVATLPTVRVVDAYGNGVAGTAVSFGVVSGGGSVVGATQLSDATGRATVGGWNLGTTAGTNTITATFAGATAPVTFTAEAIASNFDITLRFLTPVSTSQRNAFERAAKRWKKIITGDLPAFNIAGMPANSCGDNPVGSEVVDDVIIFVSIAPIDGAGDPTTGNILGQAGPCYIRSATSDPSAKFLPFAGAMEFDSYDIANIEATNRLDDVILHEMGHVLGIGSLWGTSYFNLLVGSVASGGTDPYYSGANGRSRFTASGGGFYLGNIVPVEAGGGAGTRDSHWRESVLGRELMTGYISASGLTNPLSSITIGSLADMGYIVNYGEADSYVVGSALVDGGTGGAAGGGAALRLYGDVRPSSEIRVWDRVTRTITPLEEWVAPTSRQQPARKSGQ